VRLIWPVAKRGRPRRRSIPDILSVPAEDMLADAKWQTVSWRTARMAEMGLAPHIIERLKSRRRHD
jgi:hypothetical protein